MHETSPPPPPPPPPPLAASGRRRLTINLPLPLHFFFVRRRLLPLPIQLADLVSASFLSHRLRRARSPPPILPPPPPSQSPLAESAFERCQGGGGGGSEKTKEKRRWRFGTSERSEKIPAASPPSPLFFRVPRGFSFGSRRFSASPGGTLKMTFFPTFLGLVRSCRVRPHTARYESAKKKFFPLRECGNFLGSVLRLWPPAFSFPLKVRNLGHFLFLAQHPSPT